MNWTTSQITESVIKDLEYCIETENPKSCRIKMLYPLEWINNEGLNGVKQHFKDKGYKVVYMLNVDMNWCIEVSWKNRKVK